ncbi:MAG: PAS domain-containing protein [Hyphomicrobiaceae bacterium]
MKQRTSQILFKYWNDVRGDRLAPLRLEIEPMRISPILAETFILEQADHHSFTFRLAGTRLCDQIGSELRGTDFLDLVGEDDRETMELAMADVSQRGAVAVFEIEMCDASQRSVHFEAVVLPLLHARDSISRYLGALSPVDPPYWLGHEPLHAHALARQEIIWPDGRPHAVVERAGHQAPFLPALAQARVVRFNRRQFRILEGGRQDQK